MIFLTCFECFVYVFLSYWGRTCFYRFLYVFYTFLLRFFLRLWWHIRSGGPKLQICSKHILKGFAAGEISAVRKVISWPWARTGFSYVLVTFFVRVGPLGQQRCSYVFLGPPPEIKKNKKTLTVLFFNTKCIYIYIYIYISFQAP